MLILLTYLKFSSNPIYPSSKVCIYSLNPNHCQHTVDRKFQMSIFYKSIYAAKVMFTWQYINFFSLTETIQYVIDIIP